MRSIVYVFTLSLFFATATSLDFDQVATFVGTFPGYPATGDLFGQAISISDANSVQIGAPGADPYYLFDDGAVYLFGKKRGVWGTAQSPIYGPAALDLLASTMIISRGEWLFIGAPGTPLNNSYVKDFAGSVLVYRKVFGQWISWQTLSNPLGPVNGAGNFFGANVAYDGGDWLAVGGFGTFNAWFYLYNHESNQWGLFQTITIPLNPFGAPGYVFVAIDGCNAFVGEPVPQFQTFNSKVYALVLGDEWVITQTLQGFNNPGAYGVGDFFGEFMSISGRWATISAPYDSQISPVAGAVYILFQGFDNQWSITQKVFSDAPSALFGFGVIVHGNLIVVGDCGRTVGSNIFQGAGLPFQLFGETGSAVVIN